MSDVLVKSIYTNMDKCCKRPGIAATDLPGGVAFNIFNIANAAIVVKALFGVVTTIIGAGQAVPRLQFTPAVGGAITPLCAAAARIDTDAVGTVYNFPLGTIAAVLAPAATLGIAASNETGWSGSYICLVPGIISVTNAVASTGVIDWYIVYAPCSSNALVTAL